jgi:hypothetical protein
MAIPAPKAQRTKQFAFVFCLSVIAVLCLGAFQYGDRHELNGMPFAQVQQLVSNLPEAQRLANSGNIDLFAGQSVPGDAVTLQGEFTDANCFLSTHAHAYDHAFCAKLCVAAGSPLVFVSDSDGKLYVVLTLQNAMRLPENILDQIGIPGIKVKGKVLRADGFQALAVDGLAE